MRINKLDKMGPIDQETFFVPNAGPIMIQEGTNELAKVVTLKYVATDV